MPPVIDKSFSGVLGSVYSLSKCLMLRVSFESVRLTDMLPSVWCMQCAISVQHYCGRFDFESSC
jgi:hypothetical protein